MHARIARARHRIPWGACAGRPRSESCRRPCKPHTTTRALAQARKIRKQPWTRGGPSQGTAASYGRSCVSRCVTPRKGQPALRSHHIANRVADRCHAIDSGLGCVTTIQGAAAGSAPHTSGAPFCNPWLVQREHWAAAAVSAEHAQCNAWRRLDATQACAP